MRKLVLFLCLSCPGCNRAPDSETPPLYFASELPTVEGTFERSQLGTLRERPNSSASVTLGDETRRAFAASLPSQLSFAVEVPPEPSLQLAIAVATLDNEHWSPVQFRVLANTAKDNDVVFSETVQSGIVG
jgi:hypothetical protein